MTILTRIFLTFSLLFPQLIFCATINFPQEAKEWFFNSNSPNTKELRKFNIKDFGAQPSSQIPQTGAIQKAIDAAAENGANKNILIENCDFGYCHSTLTLGSEAIFCENILLRNSTFNGASRILWLKMRPDTPQIYKNVQIENLKGESYNFILMRPWTQFFDLKGRQDKPKSLAENIHVENIDIKCKIFFNVEESTDYDFDNFTFKNIKATAETLSKDPKVLKKFNLENFDFKGKEKKTDSPQ